MAKIVLQNTLSDFLDAESHSSGEWPVPRVYIAYRAVSYPDTKFNLSHNKRYLYPQWRESKRNASSFINERILVPQALCWMLGNMPAVFYDHERKADGGLNNFRNDTNQTISVLDAQSQFQPIFCNSLEEVLGCIKDSVFNTFLPDDRLVESLRYHVRPDVHYELLTKRGLAVSGLPTPAAQIIDFDEFGTHGTNESLDDAVTRAVTIIENRSPPFVLKTTYGASGKGTFLVSTPEDHKKVVETIKTLLPQELEKLNSDNANLHPCSLVLTRTLPGRADNINFYVRYNGQAHLCSVSEQHFSETNTWSGGGVTYSKQPYLRGKYSEIVNKAASFLHSHGYHGPAGVDVMSDESGEQFIIDLNARATSSFILGCLQSHFADGLSFDVACTVPHVELPATRASFTEAFDRELKSGQVIVLAWYSDPESSCSYATFAVGAENDDSLKELCERIRGWA